jgi:hypothetical protein
MIFPILLLLPFGDARLNFEALLNMFSSPSTVTTPPPKTTIPQPTPSSSSSASGSECSPQPPTSSGTLNALVQVLFHGNRISFQANLITSVDELLRRSRIAFNDEKIDHFLTYIGIHDD